MEVKVKNIKSDSTLKDTGIITDVHTVELRGMSSDGMLGMKLVIKSEDPDRIGGIVRMVHGTKMDLELSDVDHTLDQFDTAERPPISPEEAGAHAARLEAAKAQD